VRERGKENEPHAHTHTIYLKEKNKKKRKTQLCKQQLAQYLTPQEQIIDYPTIRIKTRDKRPRRKNWPN
jgi:hypothetical protein